ncbi:MAG: sugar ABC transporter substrate-binding protein [Treponema sp.]|jgi:ribose transport system substrate-binding protein|nr:sugar ABC transporter substrate-binding protein [Treponema sp.]
MKKIFYLACVLGVIFTAQQLSARPSTQGGGRTIGVILLGTDIQHCRDFQKGIEDVCAGHGDKVVVLDPNWEIARYAPLVDDLIAMKVDGIIIEGLDQEAHIGAIKAANAAGIDVVQSDNWCKDESITAGQAASDNFDAGYQCGLDAVKKLGGRNIRAIVLSNPGSPAADDRTNGFKKAVAEAGGRIVAEQRGNGVEQGARVADDLLQANPTANVIMGNHDPAAYGALSSVKAIGKTGQILIYGVDGNPENLEAIKAGEIAGTAKQDPYKMGAVSAEFLYNKWEGKTYEKKVQIPIQFVNSDNVDKFL